MLSPKTLPGHNVLLRERAGSAEALFAVVGAHVAGTDAQLAARIRERLMRRHLRRSVDLGNGFALPHAAVPGLSTLRAVYVRSAAPIVMASGGGPAVKNSLTLLIPSPGLAAEYELLMALTQTLQADGVALALRRARSAAAVQRLLTTTATPRDAFYVAALSGSAAGAAACVSASSR